MNGKANFSLEKFFPTFKNVYVTVPQTFERFCKGCNELAEVEVIGGWMRIKCKAEKCIK